MDEAALSLPRQDIRKLLGAASGDAALLYLYLKSGFDPEQARDAFHMTQPQLDCAMAALRQLGLVAENHRYLEQEDRPVYTERDVAKEMEQSKTFGDLVGEVQRRLGRVLSTEELKIVLSIRDYLRLSDEVIGILINYCIDRNRARGNVRTPSLRSIEKEAYYWADNGIDNLEAAAAFVQTQLVRQSRLGSIRRALQINDRRLTVSEEKYVTRWLEMGFGEQEILLAYDRTCLRAGGLKWNYMDSILNSWNEQHLYTVEQIQQRDKAPERGAARQPAETGELDPMVRKAIERRRRQKEES